MSDVLFRYLLMARRRERSVWRRLFADDERWLEAGVEQLVETAAAKVSVLSQHERTDRQLITDVPTSRRESVDFYEVAQPNRPTAGRFEERRGTMGFPIRNTVKTKKCRRCDDSGNVRCDECQGRSRVDCAVCDTTGLHLLRVCENCQGEGTHPCWNCDASGKSPCEKCDGEGRLASWTVEFYEWYVGRTEEEVFPLAETRLKDAFRRWREIDWDRTPSLEPEAAFRHLGFESPEALEVIENAETARARLADEADQSPDACLFHRARISLAPVGYTVVRRAGVADHYWLVGRGEKAREFSTQSRLDRLKLAGWLGFGSGGVVGWEALVRVADSISPGMLAGIPALAGLPEGWLIGAAASSGLLALSGAQRIFAHKRRVATIGILPASGHPTSWLTCLAYFGSFTQRLKVLDRAYDIELDRLLGNERPWRQSANLTAITATGQRVRLVEVARVDPLSDDQLRLMLQAVDGVLILDDEDFSTKDIERRLQHIIEKETARPLIDRWTTDWTAIDRVAIQQIAIDRSGEADLEDSTRVPVEAMRRAYVEDMTGRIDWSAHFDCLWKPIESLLQSSSRAAVVRTRTAAGA